MHIDFFFSNYTKLENLWQNFLQHELSYRNTSALGITSMRICYYVMKNPGCALKEIALSLNISLGSASQMVQAMSISGLLQSSANKDDRRRISIYPLAPVKNFFETVTI